MSESKLPKKDRLKPILKALESNSIWIMATGLVWGFFLAPAALTAASEGNILVAAISEIPGAAMMGFGYLLYRKSMVNAGNVKTPESHT